MMISRDTVRSALRAGGTDTTSGSHIVHTPQDAVECFSHFSSVQKKLTRSPLSKKPKLINEFSSGCQQSFALRKNSQNHSKQNSNHEKNNNDNSSVSNCTGTLIDLTNIDGQHEGTENFNLKKKGTIQRRNEEIDGDIDCSDVAKKLFSSDFQSTSYDATDIPFKKSAKESSGNCDAGEKPVDSTLPFENIVPSRGPLSPEDFPSVDSPPPPEYFPSMDSPPPPEYFQSISSPPTPEDFLPLNSPPPPEDFPSLNSPPPPCDPLVNSPLPPEDMPSMNSPQPPEYFSPPPSPSIPLAAEYDHKLPCEDPEVSCNR
ncbi:hypothetical protein ACROYT_G001411 [Oculina patagonica]